MWSFIWLLIVGGYLLVKYIDISSDKIVYARRQERSREINKSITIPRDEELDIIDSLSNPEQRWELLESISHDLKYVFGEEWRTSISRDKEVISGTFFSPINIAFHIYLSSIGYIPIMFSYNYNLQGKKEIMMLKLRAVEIIEKNMRNHGHDVELILIPEHDYDIISNKMIYSSDITSGGIIWWKHNIISMDKDMKNSLIKPW